MYEHIFPNWIAAGSQIRDVLTDETNGAEKTRKMDTKLFRIDE